MSHSASQYCLDKTQCLLYCAWCPIPHAQVSSQHPKLSLVSQGELSVWTNEDLQVTSLCVSFGDHYF